VNVSLGLVKTAADEQAEALLAREARWLRELETVRELEGHLPRVLEEGTSPLGQRYLVLSLLPAGGETRAFTPDHAHFLSRLGKARFRVAEFEVSGTGQWLQGALSRAREFTSTPEMRTLQGSWEECETALLYWTGPYVLAQGDFAPWNVRNLGSQLFVTDWGHARADASPLEDVLHYLMIQRALHGRAVTVPVLCQAMKRAGEFAGHAYPQWSWRPQVIGALTLVYLLGAVLQRSLAPRRIERGDRVVGAFWKLLERRSAWMPK